MTESVSINDTLNKLHHEQLMWHIKFMSKLTPLFDVSYPGYRTLLWVKKRQTVGIPEWRCLVHVGNQIASFNQFNLDQQHSGWRERLNNQHLTARLLWSYPWSGAPKHWSLVSASGKIPKIMINKPVKQQAVQRSEQAESLSLFSLCFFIERPTCADLQLQHNNALLPWLNWLLHICIQISLSRH